MGAPFVGSIFGGGDGDWGGELPIATFIFAALGGGGPTITFIPFGKTRKDLTATGEIGRGGETGGFLTFRPSGDIGREFIKGGPFISFTPGGRPGGICIGGDGVRFEDMAFSGGDGGLPIMILAPGGGLFIIFSPGGGEPERIFAPGGKWVSIFMPGGGVPGEGVRCGDTVPLPCDITFMTPIGGGPVRIFTPGGRCPFPMKPGGIGPPTGMPIDLGPNGAPGGAPGGWGGVLTWSAVVPASADASDLVSDAFWLPFFLDEWLPRALM